MMILVRLSQEMRKTTVGYSEYIVKATNGLEKREGEIERNREKQNEKVQDGLCESRKTK